EVAELREDADRSAERDRLDRSELAEEQEPAGRGDEHGAREAAGRTLDRLARADGGRELVTADGPPGQVRPAVGSHRGEHGAPDPPPAGVRRPEQHEVRGEEPDGQYAQQREPEPRG